VIAIEYAVIGLMAAAGAIFTIRKVFSPKAEQIFYAMFLMMIAGFYLAFTAYFGISCGFAYMPNAVEVQFPQRSRN